MITGRLTALLLLASLSATASGFQPSTPRTGPLTTTNDAACLSRLFCPIDKKNRRRSLLARPAAAAAATVSLSPRRTGRKRRVARQVVPISTAFVIGLFSVLEILESAHELVERRLGHAHGIVVLAFIRLCRSVAVLQTEVEEGLEGLAKSGLEEELENGNNFLARVGRFLTSPLLTIVASVLAGFACLIEIFDDMMPGGHHGAALLALSELSFQIRRLRRLKKVPKRTFLTRVPLGMLVCLAAATYACVEIYEDMKPGAHHSVAVLALAELIENMNRSKILKRFRVL